MHYSIFLLTLPLVNTSSPRRFTYPCAMGTTKEYELFKAAKFVLNVRNNLKVSVKHADSGTQRYAYF